MLRPVSTGVLNLTSATREILRIQAALLNLRPPVSQTCSLHQQFKFKVSKAPPEQPKPKDVPRDSVEALFYDAATFQDHLTDKAWASSPYPRRLIPRSEKSVRADPLVDPTMRSVLLFPGQGSQYVSMGKNLLEYPSVPEMFDAASEILGYDLKKLCLEGPKEKLNMTVHHQPAILVTSLAALQKLRVENAEAIDNCIAAAGFSVGEYAALVFAGAISFEAAVRIVKVRAEAMQAAWQLVLSATGTIFLRPDARIEYACGVAEQWCKKLGVKDPHCKISGYLFPSCKLIAGNKEALQFIQTNANEFGIRSYKRHKLTGPFHTPLMKPAEPALREILSKVSIKKPLISVHSNVNGKAFKDASDIRTKLVCQISSPVKWEQIMHILYARQRGIKFPNTYECGPGTTLKRVLSYVNRQAYNSTTSLRA